MDEQEQGAVFVDEKAFTDVDAKKKKRRKRFIIVFSVLAFILIAGYFSMVYVASSRFNPGTVISVPPLFVYL